MDGTDSEVKTEAMTVYRLYEEDNLFVFNQTSAVGFDRTILTWFGARHINDAETVIVEPVHSMIMNWIANISGQALALNC